MANRTGKGTFKAGHKPVNKRGTRGSTMGRPPRITSSIAEVCSKAELDDLLRTTYERALKGEATSLLWLLSQMPKLDTGFTLPAGLPRLTSIKACVDAVALVGEMASDGKITVFEAEKSLALINAIAHSRISILAKAAEKLDAELRTVLEHDRQIDLQQALPAPNRAAPVFSPSSNGS
jgi:hypothetical protein